MRYVVAFIAIFVLGLVLRAGAADGPSAGPYRIVTGAEPDRQEIADLKDRIDDLQAELDRLKDRLKALEDKPRILSVPAPAPRPFGKPIPPDWRRREFNGQEFYIIPLAKEPPAE
ncbi:MAG TPA: hypothetical protein VGN42_18370 [Pirellulales bacterium]|nr:hypothetical protein [Pirellulales bacterium]